MHYISAMIRYFFLVFLLIGCFSDLCAQKLGCTDPSASNYDPQAQKNDGSCLYPVTNVSLKKICTISDTLQETSGLIYFESRFWSHNDGGNEAAIYALDEKTGAITHRTFISNAQNNDWEDMTQDSSHIYIGDFGNNNGNRKDLHILKIKKSDIHLDRNNDTVDAEFIWFDMADQTNFNLPSQGHDYDMEAMFWHDGKLHLLSKNWADKASRHYLCTTDTGHFHLLPTETLTGAGLVTGACISKNGVVALSGYGTDYKTFIRIIWDCTPEDLNAGNKRRFETGNGISPGQTESACFEKNLLYITSEKAFSSQQLYKVDVNGFLNDSFRSVGLISPMRPVKVIAYNSQQLIVQNFSDQVVNWQMVDTNGKTISDGKLIPGENTISISELSRGNYVFVAESKTSFKFAH